MKNCLEFCVTKLTQFIMTFGVFEIIDVLNKFQVITDVVTLDRSYLKTDDLEKMKFGAFVSEYGLHLKAQSDLVKHLVELITNPGSVKEAITINSALKILSLKHVKSRKFYDMLSEGLHRRMLFSKLSQIYAPLIEEVKVNKELLIMLLNNGLMEVSHLQDLYGNDQSPTIIAHYIVHNMNSYKKLKKFTYICQNWVTDTNMIEQLNEIAFECEIFQCARINEKITEDSQNNICTLY